MKVIELNDDTFIMYAIKNYENPNCTGLSEFNDDLQRFKYLKRLFGKAKRGDLKERLIINHIVILYNLFGIEAATRMLFYKIGTEDWPQLKTFLVFLNFMPEKLITASGKILPSADIGLDTDLMDVLRKI